MPTDSISGNIVEHLRRTAQQLPKQLAVLSANDSFESKTFESLFKDVELCALFFIKRGINKSDRTLLMVKPGYELIISSCIWHFVSVDNHSPTNESEVAVYLPAKSNLSVHVCTHVLRQQDSCVVLK